MLQVFNKATACLEEAMSDTKHITTPECGFDRNSTHSTRSYICMCGWVEHPAVTLSPLGRELINAAKLEAENAALREDAERYRWFRLQGLWDADRFPWPHGFEYPEGILQDEGKMLDAAIDAARKS